MFLLKFEIISLTCIIILFTFAESLDEGEKSVAHHTSEYVGRRKNHHIRRKRRRVSKPSNDGLLKTVVKGLQNTVDNTVNLVDDKMGSGLVGNLIKGVDAVARDAIDGTEKIVSEAADHLGDAVRAAHHGLQSLVYRGNETMKDIGSLLEDTGVGVKGVVSNALLMVSSITGDLGK